MGRAGQYLPEPTGYRAFHPAPLPPDPPLALDGELLGLLSEADRAIGRLDLAAEILPDPSLFVGMHVRLEATLSSRIEGTQSTLEDLLQEEVAGSGEPRIRDVEEVVNYVAAMNHGLARLAELPLSLRLLKEMHAILLRSGRGAGATPGEFRRSQNWIGAPGATLRDAAFVPPPPHAVLGCLGALEKYLHEASEPPLIQAGLAHAQFETIHPFVDGNGRVGRLLVTLMLCEKGLLRRPVLYLSRFLLANRTEYYDRLTRVRGRGDWEGWLRFFLRGVAEVAGEAVATTRAIAALRDEHHALVAARLPGNANAAALVEHVLRSPLTTVTRASEALGCHYKTANRLVAAFVELGILEPASARARNRVFRNPGYLRLFRPGS